MAIRYKQGIMQALKDKGYSSARLRKEKILGERTMQEIRSQGTIPYKTLDRLCFMLDCRIEDVIEYVPDAHDDGQDDTVEV